VTVAAGVPPRTEERAANKTVSDRIRRGNAIALSESLQVVMDLTRGEPHGDSKGRLEGSYANYFQIGHNAHEFVLEFGQKNEEDVLVHTRLYLTPAHAEALSGLLESALAEYKRAYGPARPVDVE